MSRRRGSPTNWSRRPTPACSMTSTAGSVAPQQELDQDLPMPGPAGVKRHGRPNVPLAFRRLIPQDGQPGQPELHLSDPDQPPTVRGCEGVVGQGQRTGEGGPKVGREKG